MTSGGTPATAPPAPRPRRWRWLLWLLLLPLLLVLALPLGAYALLASERGSAWLLQQLAGVAADQGVSIAFTSSHGSLLERIELRGLTVDAAQTRVAAASLLLAWRPRALLDRVLHVEQLAVDGLRVALPPASDEPAQAPQLPALRVPLTLRIDRATLDDVRLQQADGDLVLDHLGLSALLDSAAIRIDGLQLRVAGAQLDGALGLATTAPHALDGSLRTTLPATLTGPDIGEMRARMTLSGEALRPELVAAIETPLELRARADAVLDQVAPAFSVDVSWPQLYWPLHGTAQYRAAAGSLALRGTPDDYRLTLRAPLSLPDLPEVALALQAQGDTAGLRLQPLTLGVGDGRVEADGTLTWTDGVRTDLALAVDGVDPGLFAADWPGRLDGRLRLDGRFGGDAAMALDVAIERLAGSLRGYPVAASGGVALRGDALTARALDLTSGPNRVRVYGRADRDLDLAFTIEAPQLAALYPGLDGALQGSGTLRGTQDRPALSAQLSGSEVGFDGARIAALELGIDWRDQRGTANLTATGLVSGETRISALSAALDGGIADHRVQLSADGPAVRVAFGAQGGWDQRAAEWRGTLRNLDANSLQLGDWRLGKATPLRAGADLAKVDGLCLEQGATSLCVDGGWSRAKGLDLDGRLAALDLARFAAQLPGEAVIAGSLDASVRVEGPPQRPAATFELRPDDGEIRVDEGLEPVVLAYRDARVSGRFADDRGEAELGLRLGSSGRAGGRLTLGAARDGGRALGGRVDAEFPDLTLVAGFVPALQAVSGRLRVALALGGTLAQPAIDGELRISDAAATLPAAGIELRDFGLQVRGDGQGPLAVDGSVTSGDGRIAIRGQVDPVASDGPAVDLRIRGDDFLAVRLPEATARVSPDLRLQGRGSYRLTGTLRIPQAAIELQELPQGTVAVSDDAVIVGRDAPAAPAARRQALDAAIAVVLGDDVTFAGFGLKTRLEGSLDAQSGQRGTLVDGKIELRDASYKAYGQDLKVEQGRLLFAGPPGNPEVDLRAVRESRDGRVRAYLAMSGPLAEPRPRVYTEPALPEAEAVAYLLTGRGLAAASAGEGQDIGSAALSLGLSRSEPLLQDLGDRLGLDDLRVDNGSGGIADSSLLLGKYLNPDLYLGYSQGLFNPEGAVLLRLRLSERLEVESRSGSEQSVDLFYKIEHD
ncbi:MAG: translocation/assembly module TamB domain-containing protein [Gammaproteobacteria bacterium]|nr:translocation/assembly module TamB domain-containing protein [Gammaproteobacteria bacterium]